MQSVPFILSPKKTALSQRKPASAGTSHDSCSARGSDERDSVYSRLQDLLYGLRCFVILLVTCREVPGYWLRLYLKLFFSLSFQFIVRQLAALQSEIVAVPNACINTCTYRQPPSALRRVPKWTRALRPKPHICKCRSPSGWRSSGEPPGCPTDGAANGHSRHFRLSSIFPKSQASAVVELNSSVFWVITLRKVVWNRRFGTTYWSHLQGSSFLDTLFETDVSGLPIGSHVQGSGFLNSLTLEDGTDSRPETSVLNHLTLLNNSEDGRITLRRLVVTYVLGLRVDPIIKI
jgi:hypothetical protein